jgi:rSAM/selenodomain-associated transferase 2
MRISVIIPVLNEEKAIGETLRASRLLIPDELIIVDGGSADRTVEICSALGEQVIASPPGRARQMNCGARHATGDVLLFLHADTRLPSTAFADIRAVLSDPAVVGGRFDIRLDGNGWMLKLLGILISWRSRLTGVATGDQAIFVRSSVFTAMGGFPELPLMEDIAFCRDLKRKGAIACLRSHAITSSRRWAAQGVWRTIFRMWTLKALYLVGVSAVCLRRYYDDPR